MQEHQIEWTRVKNDVNGNPRYVCHFTARAYRSDIVMLTRAWNRVLKVSRSVK